MSKNLFISYSHSDNNEHQWLERLKGFLDALQEQLPLKIWEDTQIPYGSDWFKQIEEALDQSAAAILLVGQGFLASKFIADNELPKMILPGKQGNIRLYILYTGWCPWQFSALAKYQAFNNPDQPLESLDKPTQNKWLNDLCVAIKKDLESASIIQSTPTPVNELHINMQTIKNHLEETQAAFHVQIRRLRNLTKTIKMRLEVSEDLEYEQFFIRYYDQMNTAEHFEFDQIRALTEGILFESNNAIFQIITQHPTLRDELPILGALKTHLIIWLNKYKRVFSSNSKMAVCFTGVEDGVPFPFGVDEEVTTWINTH